MRQLEIHKTLHVHALQHLLVIGRVLEVVVGHKIHQSVVMRLAVGIAPFGQGVVFQHGQLVFRDAVFGFKIVLVVFVADVVNAPVFAVDEEYGRPVILCFHAKLFGQGLKQAVAKDGKVPVVAGIAEQETLEAVEVFVGKQLIIKFLRAVLRTHDDAE